MKKKKTVIIPKEITVKGYGVVKHTTIKAPAFVIQTVNDELMYVKRKQKRVLRSFLPHFRRLGWIQWK